MTFEIDINGRTHLVSVARAAEGKYHVVLDGQARELDAARSGPYELSIIVEGDGTSRDVQVTPSGNRAEYLVTLGGRLTPVSINARQTGRRGGDSGSGVPGEQPVVAPMPGRVVRILVVEGDEVELRQGLVVIEAMKMENELRSPKAGRVKAVGVSPGASVEAGQVLLIVE